MQTTDIEWDDQRREMGNPGDEQSESNCAGENLLRKREQCGGCNKK